MRANVTRVREKCPSSLSVLRTFALIVSGHPYCARNSRRDVMPHHTLSAHAVGEMYRYTALLGILRWIPLNVRAISAKNIYQKTTHSTVTF